MNILSLSGKKKILQNLTKPLYIFLRTPDEVEKYVGSNYSDNCVHHYNFELLSLFYPELQLIISKSLIKNKLKELLSELKEFKFQAILVLHFKKRNNCKIFHSSAKLIASDSGIAEVFKSIHQSIMTKIKIYACKDWIFLDVIIKHSIETVVRFLSVSIWRIKGTTFSFYTG